MAAGTDAALLRHLLRRAGFGVTSADLARHAGRRPEAVVEDLLAAPAERPALAELAAIRLPGERAPLDPARLPDIQIWWLRRMAATAAPLREKMTLFWHDHFATAFYKVQDARLMLRQNELLRRHALGNFRTLLLEVSHDPAMLIWLDSNANRKRAPNENYARELMELFTVGLGHYTEDDVKAAARAFTGWHCDRKAGRFVFRAGEHDFGEKVFLGRVGRWDGGDVVDILASHEATARFLAAKLWRWFGAPEPDESAIAAMARAYLDSRCEIGAMLRALFLSPAFAAAAGRKWLVKSPVELVVGMHRALGVAPDRRAVAALRAMGQELFNPPNVAGWKGGEAWLNAGTMLARVNYAAELVAAASPGPPASAWVEEALRLAGVDDPSSATRTALARYASEGDGARSAGADREAVRWCGLLRLVLSAPEYQLA